jgi:hypothetical protein
MHDHDAYVNVYWIWIYHFHERLMDINLLVLFLVRSNYTQVVALNHAYQ